MSELDNFFKYIDNVENLEEEIFPHSNLIKIYKKIIYILIFQELKQLSRAWHQICRLSHLILKEEMNL